MSRTNSLQIEPFLLRGWRRVSKVAIALVLISIPANNARGQKDDTTALYRAVIHAVQDAHPHRKVFLVGRGRADTLLNRAEGLPVRASSELRKCAGKTCQLVPNALLVTLNPVETKEGKAHVLVIVMIGPDGGGVVPTTAITEYAYDVELAKRGSTWVAIAHLRYRS